MALSKAKANSSTVNQKAWSIFSCLVYSTLLWYAAYTLIFVCDRFEQGHDYIFRNILIIETQLNQNHQSLRFEYDSSFSPQPFWLQSSATELLVGDYRHSSKIIRKTGTTYIKKPSSIYTSLWKKTNQSTDVSISSFSTTAELSTFLPTITQ